MNKRVILFIVLLLVQMACVIPAIQQLGQPSQVIIITATVGAETGISQIDPTPTPLPEVFDCKGLESGNMATIDAKPIGVHLRVSPDSDSISVIPDGEKIEVFGSYNSGWSLVRWNDLCGYVSSDYIIGQ
jgi:hypothetical protein